MPRARELVGETVDERLLGPDDHERDVLRHRELDQLVERTDADRHAARQLLDPRIARRRDDLVTAARESPHERVLPAAVADDEDLHGRFVIPHDLGVAQRQQDTGTDIAVHPIFRLPVSGLLLPTVPVSRRRLPVLWDEDPPNGGSAASP